MRGRGAARRALKIRMPPIHVLDYDAGNVRSLLNALASLGYAP